ncbi:MAG TPA: hydrogenase maturation protease [Gemmatimonadales bacterium]|nr:hydrogenase maturation protease [Gemmatimonadales bacterium]
MRTLIAGFGNVLRGDDGFGSAVIRRLETEPLEHETDLLDAGIGGLHLARQLLSGYDRVIVIDAMVRGGAPGTLYLQRVTDVEPEERIDPHLARPATALGLAKTLGALPPDVLLVGCEPAVLEEPTLELSPSVQAAVEPAARHVLALLRE